MVRKIQIVLWIPLAFALLSVFFRETPSPNAQSVAASARTIETPARFSDADFAAHVEQLKKKLPSDDFTIIIQPPFVVIGDEPADDVKEHSERTVKWAVDKLKQEYFSKDPKEILDIWLFKDCGVIRTQRATAVRRKADHAVRVLLEHAQSPGDEHLDRRRHARS